MFFFFYQENVAVRTPATVRTVLGKLFNNGKHLCEQGLHFDAVTCLFLLKLTRGFLTNLNNELIFFFLYLNLQTVPRIQPPEI